MECWEVRPYLESLVDDALDQDTKSLIESHLAACQQCSQILRVQHRMKQLLKSTSERVQAPESLRQRILAQMDQLDREESQRESIWQRYFLPQIWVPALVGLFLLAAFFWITYLSPPAPLLEAIEYHARYQTHRPVEGISSSDPARVREWLSAKLAFPVPVPLIPELTLVGGWIETVDKQKIANILYQKNNQIFSLLIQIDREQVTQLPTNRQIGSRSIYVGEAKGYTAVLWKDDGMSCAFVGNLPEQELLRYALQAMPI